MCQLLALSAKRPESLALFLPEFFARGGITDKHADGWGAAFFEPECPHRATLHREEVAAGRSERAAALALCLNPAVVAFAHVRHASVEPATLLNTHPFSRQVWGRDVVFAHNGWLKDFGPGFSPDLPPAYAPKGRTDSEYAFGRLMMDVEALHPELPGIEVMTRTLARASREIAAHGNFNTLLSDGRALWVRSTDDLWLGRTALGGALIATQPLAACESWTLLDKGKLYAFVDGALAFAA